MTTKKTPPLKSNAVKILSKLSDLDALCQPLREKEVPLGDRKVKIMYRTLTPREARQINRLAAGIVQPMKDNGNGTASLDVGSERMVEYTAKTEEAGRRQRAMALSLACPLFSECREPVSADGTDDYLDKLADSIEQHGDELFLETIYQVIRGAEAIQTFLDFISAGGFGEPQD